jgi:peptidylprolyl isomerase
MPAGLGDTVAVAYEGRLEDGTVFDASADGDPLRFTLGAGTVLPMFEAAVVGLEVGERVTVTIPTEDAYGPYIEEACDVVPVDVFGEGEPLAGGVFNVFADDGTEFSGRVVAISEDGVNVSVDFNHPLAGHALTFEIELVDIQPPRPANA